MNTPSTDWAFRLRVRYTVGLVALVLAGVFLLWVCRQPVLLVWLGAALGVAFFRGSRALAAWTGAPRRLALAVLVVAVLGGLVAFGGLVGPRFVGEAQAFAAAAPGLIEQARQLVGLGSMASGEAVSGMDGLLPRLLGVFSTALGAFAALLVVVIVAVYTAVNPSLYVDGVVGLFRADHQPAVRALLAEAEGSLLAWVQGVLLSVALLTALATVGLSVLGLPMAIALGVFAGLWTVIPNFGPFIGWAPAVLVGFANGTSTGLWTLGLAALAQQLEGSVITPKVQQRMVHVGPALIITAQIVLGTFTGLLGILMAVPVLVVGAAAVRHLYIEPRLKRAPAPEGRSLSDAGAASGERQPVG